MPVQKNSGSLLNAPRTNINMNSRGVIRRRDRIERKREKKIRQSYGGRNYWL